MGKETRYALGLIGRLGFVLALPPVLGGLMGVWIDTKTGINGLFLIVFLLIGLFLGGMGAWLMLKRYINWKP